MKKLLVEIDALKKEINTHRPLNEHLRKQIKEYYRIVFTYTSNALEGNSLTEIETKIVLEEGITASGKPLIHHLEAVGLSDAYDFLYTKEHDRTFSEETIKKFHWLFYQRIDISQAGQYRKESVYLTGSKYPLPAPYEIPELMRQWLLEASNQRKELHPVVFAARAHKDFVFIHPFIVPFRFKRGYSVLQDGEEEPL
jgi:Fic family protein